MNETQLSIPRSSRSAFPLFTEKTFYLEEFYGKSLLFAMVPPAGDHLAELDSLVRTLRELHRNQTRCIVIASARALPRLMRRLGRLAPRGDFGDELLDEDVERRNRRHEAVEVTGAHGREQRRALDELVAVEGEEPSLRDPVDAVVRPSHPLQERADRPR